MKQLSLLISRRWETHFPHISTRSETLLLTSWTVFFFFFCLAITSLAQLQNWWIVQLLVLNIYFVCCVWNVICVCGSLNERGLIMLKSDSMHLDYNKKKKKKHGSLQNKYLQCQILQFKHELQRENWHVILRFNS